MQWNLYGIDNKFRDVESTDSVVDYLNRLPLFKDTVPKTLSDPQPETEAPAGPVFAEQHKHRPTGRQPQAVATTVPGVWTWVARSR
jgi:hypothetical protein